MVKLQRIRYDELNAKQQENYNFQKSAAILADYGFNCIKLTDDWLGADFLACHKDGVDIIKVQLKGRVTIDRKYIDHNLYMNFPAAGNWYLVPHDELVEIVGETTNWLHTPSWTVGGKYHNANPPKKLLARLRPFALTIEPSSYGTDRSPNRLRRPQVQAEEPSSYGTDTLKVQPKGRVIKKTRVTIDKSHVGKNVCMAFPAAGNWYLVPHDKLVEIVEDVTPWLDSSSWRERGLYHSPNPSQALLDRLRPFRCNGEPSV